MQQQPTKRRRQDRTLVVDVHDAATYVHLLGQGKAFLRQAGEANGERGWQGCQDKNSGWYAGLEDPQRPVSRTLLDQAHPAMDRKLCLMQGLHHKEGSHQAFLKGLALLYNLMPYQRRAKHAGRCGVEVEGGNLPTGDGFLNLHILTCGGLR